MYYAQGVEVTLANVLMIASFEIETTTEEDVDALQRQLTAETAGRLLARRERNRLLSENEGRLCERVVKRRNHLAHNFFSEHAGDEGKRAMWELDQGPLSVPGGR